MTPLDLLSGPFVVRATFEVLGRHARSKAPPKRRHQVDAALLHQVVGAHAVEDEELVGLVDERREDASIAGQDGRRTEARAGSVVVKAGLVLLAPR